ncbi:hypothetical protein D3C86_1945090 [compost metagenome]
MTELDQKIITTLIRIANWCGNKGINEAVDDVCVEAYRKQPESPPALIGLPVIDPDLLDTSKEAGK